MSIKKLIIMVIVFLMAIVFLGNVSNAVNWTAFTDITALAREINKSDQNRRDFLNSDISSILGRHISMSDGQFSNEPNGTCLGHGDTIANANGGRYVCGSYNRY